MFFAPYPKWKKFPYPPQKKIAANYVPAATTEGAYVAW